MEEQSVLDYIIATIRWFINPGRYKRPHLESEELTSDIRGVDRTALDRPDQKKPEFEGIIFPAEPILTEIAAPTGQESQNVPEGIFDRKDDINEERGRQFGKSRFPWRASLSLLTAIWAQILLEPPTRSPKIAIIFYGISGFLLIWAVLKKEWVLLPLREEEKSPMCMTIRPHFLVFTLVFVAGLMILFGGNRFNPVNLLFWGLAFYYVIRSMVVNTKEEKSGRFFSRIPSLIKNPKINIQISGWHLLILIAGLAVIFFRFYRLDGVPGEMFSDHAEKLMDVGDVLNGKTSIFFPRNTGREAVQMYLTAAIALICKTGLSFISLKLGTALAGLLTLPYVYRLGKEVGNKWVGLLALVLAGFGYWPNLISRIGLRFPFYPLFVAPVLFYLFRGIRTSNRMDMVKAGIALGLGLHGYSPMRIVPIVILILIGLYLLHPQARGKRAGIVTGIIVLALVAFIIFLPLFRYMLDDLQMFGLRAFSRIGTTERAFPGPVWQIFLSNLWKAMIMFFWDNGGIWVHSIVGRPALDVITAALFFSGCGLLIIRYIRQRNWTDLWLLISIPLLMMPSILSLAFPDENPSLNRTGGAIVPVFIIAAVALESLLAGMKANAKGLVGKALPLLVGVGLLTGSAVQNYDLVFNQFDRQFMAGAWNTSEIGHVIKAFSESVGNPDTAYVVPYPYWVDTRLVGINAGFPQKDYALWPEHFSETLAENRAKLFVLKPEDTESLETLRTLYPSGRSWIYPGQREGKDFVLFLVPMEKDLDRMNVEP